MRHSQGFRSRVLHLFQPSKQFTLSVLCIFILCAPIHTYRQISTYIHIHTYMYVQQTHRHTIPFNYIENKMRTRQRDRHRFRGIMRERDFRNLNKSTHITQFYSSMFTFFEHFYTLHHHPTKMIQETNDNQKQTNMNV